MNSPDSFDTIERNGQTHHQRNFSDQSAIINLEIPTQVNANGRIATTSGCCSSCRQTVKTHKFWMTLNASTWGFLSSVERAIILPTLWLYLKKTWSLEEANNYYGITMGAFSLSVLLATPMFGSAAYYGIRVRTLLLVANLFEIIGNLIYLLAGAPFAVLIGRLISGIGASCEPPLYADIARATNKDERTSYIIVLLLTRQIGLIFGPSFTLIMNPMDYHFAKITLNVYNGPGLLMACLWVSHSILLLISYPIVDSSGRLVHTTSRRPICCSSLCQKKTWVALDNEIRKEDDNVPLVVDNHHNRSAHATGLALYKSYPLITLYAATLATYFCFMSLEAALPPVANHAFGWSQVQTSYVYLGCSILVILVVIVLRWLNNYFTDRTLLLAGLVIMVLSYAWLTVTVFMLDSLSQLVAICLLLSGIAIHVIGLPFAFAFSESLYTKLAPISDMDRAQSILRTIINIALLFGPFVGGFLINMPGWVFLSMTLISIIPLFLVVNRFSAFHVDDQYSPVSPTPSSVDPEGDKEC